MERVGKRTHNVDCNRGHRHVVLRDRRLFDVRGERAAFDAFAVDDFDAIALAAVDGLAYVWTAQRRLEPGWNERACNRRAARRL
jgi:hypothetical protein